MLVNGGMRASDQDREAVVAILRDAYVAGCLELNELRGRAGAVYCARTWSELERLTADLPPGAGLPGSCGAGAQVGEGLHEARVHSLAPVAPVWLAWLAIAAGVFAPAAVVPLLILALTALSAVVWATRHSRICQAKRRLACGGQHSADADSDLAA